MKNPGWVDRVVQSLCLQFKTWLLDRPFCLQFADHPWRLLSCLSRGAGIKSQCSFGSRSWHFPGRFNACTVSNQLTGCVALCFHRCVFSPFGRLCDIGNKFNQFTLSVSFCVLLGEGENVKYGCLLFHEFLDSV